MARRFNLIQKSANTRIGQFFLCSLGDAEDKQITARAKKKKLGIRGTRSPINSRLTQIPPIAVSRKLAGYDTKTERLGCANIDH